MATSESTVADRVAPRDKLPPLELARWFHEHADALVERWVEEVRGRLTSWSESHGPTLQRFFELHVAMVPATLGPYREEIEPLWLQLAELFGSISAHRGLAAGEVIEEFQVLRDVLIRLLYADPPAVDGARVSLRDLLRVNRVIDRGVTQASIGHTDALFFTLFQGSGVPESLDEDLVEEVHAQLDQIEEGLIALAGRGEPWLAPGPGTGR